MTTTMTQPVTRPLKPDHGAIRRRRLLAGAGVLVVLAITMAAVALSTDGKPATVVLVPRSELTASDPLAYEGGQDDELERAATFGLSQPLYAKSPGGVFAAARRTAEFRPMVEDAVGDSGIPADMVEAIVFLESGGRPDVIAGDDPARASGLTQILAETATSFLGMHVDLAKSRGLTTRIRAAVQRGDPATAAQLRAERRAIDSRFDPEQALAGTVRYLTTARERLGRDDLAVVSYHMGIGNLSSVLRAYVGDASDRTIPELVDDEDLSWARVFFDTTPANRSAAYALLAQLGDDSPTYYWRVLAAREIMRLYRDDPDRLRELDELHRAKASAEEVLHPGSETERFADADDLESAWSEHTLLPLPSDPVRYGFAVDSTMGELAPRLGLDERPLPRAATRGARAAPLRRRPRARLQWRWPAARGDEHRPRRCVPGAPTKAEHRGDRGVLAAHHGVLVRHPAQLRVERAGRVRSSSSSTTSRHAASSPGFVSRPRFTLQSRATPRSSCRFTSSRLRERRDQPRCAESHTTLCERR